MRASNARLSALVASRCRHCVASLKFRLVFSQMLDLPKWLPVHRLLFRVPFCYLDDFWGTLCQCICTHQGNPGMCLISYDNLIIPILIRWSHGVVSFRHCDVAIGSRVLWSASIVICTPVTKIQNISNPITRLAPFHFTAALLSFAHCLWWKINCPVLSILLFLKRVLPQLQKRRHQ